MDNWKDYKGTIKSISNEEMTIIETLSTLVAERIKRQISQKDFAAQIEMKQPQLAKLERLDSIPSFKTLSRYAAGLGFEIKMKLTAI